MAKRITAIVLMLLACGCASAPKLSGQSIIQREMELTSNGIARVLNDGYNRDRHYSLPEQKLSAMARAAVLMSATQLMYEQLSEEEQQVVINVSRDLVSKVHEAQSKGQEQGTTPIQPPGTD